MPSHPSTTIAVFGGSFNPPHSGHFAAAAHVYHTYGVTSVLMVPTHNPYKDPGFYAPLADRIAMCRLGADAFNAQHTAHGHSAIPISVPEGYAEFQDAHCTLRLLRHIQSDHPDTRILFVMGADSLISMRGWDTRDSLVSEFPILVLARPGYSAASTLTAGAAVQKHQCRSQNAFNAAASGWFYDDRNVSCPISSATYMRALRSGHAPANDLVAAYIRDKGLYPAKVLG